MPKWEFRDSFVPPVYHPRTSNSLSQGLFSPALWKSLLHNHGDTLEYNCSAYLLSILILRDCLVPLYGHCYRTTMEILRNVIVPHTYCQFRDCLVPLYGHCYRTTMEILRNVIVPHTYCQFRDCLVPLYGHCYHTTVEILRNVIVPLTYCQFRDCLVPLYGHCYHTTTEILINVIVPLTYNQFLFSGIV